MAEPSRAVQLDAALAELRVQCPDLEAASVVSYDGLPMAAALPPGMDEERVAAMCAALLSLGERASVGLGRGPLEQVSVDGEDGAVHLVSAADEAVLVGVVSPVAKTGLVLFEMRRTAKQVASILASAAAEVSAVSAVSGSSGGHVADHLPALDPVPVPDWVTAARTAAAGQAAGQPDARVAGHAGHGPALDPVPVPDWVPVADRAPAALGYAPEHGYPSEYEVSSDHLSSDAGFGLDHVPVPEVVTGPVQWADSVVPSQSERTVTQSERPMTQGWA